MALSIWCWLRACHFLQSSRTEAQRPIFRLPVGTRPAVLRKPHKPPTRARRAGIGVLSVRSTCVLNKIGIFPPCCVLVQLLHLPVIVLLECRLNRSDCEQQVAIAFAAILRRNYRRFCDEQTAFFERPDVFANRVRTQPNRITDFSLAWPALESLPIFAEQKVGVDRDFRCAQTQRENLLR